MTAALAKTPVVRTTAGEPPLGRDAAFFLDDQGEIFEHDNPRYRSSNMRIGVLALDTGEWLALPPSFHVERPRYPSREAALRAGIAAMVRRARKYMSAKDGEGTQWSEGLGRRIIEWALRLKPEKQGLVQGASEQDAPVIGHPGTANAEAAQTAYMPEQLSGAVIQSNKSDPLVRSLVEAHRARKTYPTGHTFSMPLPLPLTPHPPSMRLSD